MNPRLFISWRYLMTKRKEKFISLISIISILGIAIGVMALIVVIAVMSGFDKDLHNKIIGNYAHITISGYHGIDALGYQDIKKKISLHPQVKASSPYVLGQGLIKVGDTFFVVDLKGIDLSTAPGVIRINEYLTSGTLDGLTDNSVIIGRELASYLSLSPGSSLTIYSAPGVTHNLKVAGIFYSGMYDYDMRLAFTNLKTAQGIFNLADKFSAVAVKLDRFYLADKVKKDLAALLGFDYNIKTWIEANQNFFAALKLEKITMFIILTLIILVASFNIISTLIVMVVEKTKDIGILKAIGMSSADIRKIFTYEGILIGTSGILLGTLGGMSLCSLLKKYQFIKLPQDIYYIDRLPVAIDFWPDIALVILAALAITLVSTVYPANKAAKFSPVEALRYE